MLEQAAAGIQDHGKNDSRHSQNQSRSHGRNARMADPLGNEKDDTQIMLVTNN